MRRAWLPALAILILGLAAGAFAGAWADQAFPEYVPQLSAREAGGSLDQKTIDEAIRIVRSHYYGSGVDYSKLSQGGVRGMIQALGDPYTTYLDPSQYRNQQDSFAGRHTGVIGVYLTFSNGYPAVSGLVPGSPAEKAGLRTGDIIVSIDGKDAAGLNTDQTAALVRGQQGTKVTLGVRRDSSDLTFEIQRENFSSPMVVSLMLDPSVLYMRVYQFGTATTNEFDQQLKANLPRAKAVVLDLRDDPGGYVAAASAMISRFVADGEAYELRDRGGAVERHNVEGDHPATSIPLTVLVNGGTASAAEIVAGSLQARHRARLVGVKTYGKGSVQIDYPLQDGGDLHLTVQHWFLPDGRTIDKTGLQPDETVALGSPASMFDAIQPSLGHQNDTQLNTALHDLGG
jgi:carboxyl-terminal processing protease